MVPLGRGRLSVSRFAYLLNLTAVSLALVVMFLSVCGSAGAQSEPILAGPWASYQEGYGHVRPSTVFNGGDPTGLVRQIEWLTWGGSRAVGVGLGFYVAPNQITAEGTRQSVVIVLFQLGTCHRRRAYNAMEWYFPEHSEHFNPHQYINACTGQYYPR
jgi:hypothetical protein